MRSTRTRCGRPIPRADPSIDRAPRKVRGLYFRRDVNCCCGMYCCVLSCGRSFLECSSLSERSVPTLGQLCGPWDARSTNRFLKRRLLTSTHALAPRHCTDSTTQLTKIKIKTDTLGPHRISREVWRLCHILRRRRRLRSPAAYSAEERGRAAILRAAAYASTLLLLLHFRPISSVADGPNASALLDGRSRRRLLLAVAAAAADADDEDNDAWVLLRSTRRSPALVLSCSRRIIRADDVLEHLPEEIAREGRLLPLQIVKGELQLSDGLLDLLVLVDAEHASKHGRDDERDDRGCVAAAA